MVIDLASVELGSVGWRVCESRWWWLGTRGLFLPSNHKKMSVCEVEIGINVIHSPITEATYAFPTGIITQSFFFLSNLTIKRLSHYLQQPHQDPNQKPSPTAHSSPPIYPHC